MIRSKQRLFLFAFFLLLFFSCSEDITLSPSEGPFEEKTVQCSFQFSEGSAQFPLRSSTVSNPSAVSDVNLFIYRYGALQWALYQDGSAPITVPLSEGESYSAYAIANAGKLEAPSQESAMLTFQIDAQPLSGGLIPMTTVGGRSFSIPKGSKAERITLELTRSFARVDFSIDRIALTGGSFSVTSVRLCQASRRVGAFSLGSRAMAAGEVGQGDSASQTDLSSLNAGGSVSFYVPENMQGTLLKGNTDPWQKEYFNAGLSSVRDLCTYIQAEGRYEAADGSLSALHTYRMYLGEDATTNFDIERNTVYSLILSVSDTGPWRDSWKMERSVNEALRIEWQGNRPQYVAQAGVITCSNALSGASISAVSSDTQVARVKQSGGAIRVEAIKEGSATITVTANEGGSARSAGLDIEVRPVYLQTAEINYLAYIDGGANALGLSGSTPWSVSYNIPRSSFDDELYSELLSPRFVINRNNGADEIANFQIDENGLYVKNFGDGISNVCGTYELYVTPEANIYKNGRECITRSVTVRAPVSTGIAFTGENRYYMPDASDAMQLLSSGSVTLGAKSNLSICLSPPTASYGQGSGFVPCPFEAASGTITLSPNYSDIINNLGRAYYLRGGAYKVMARLRNSISGQTADFQIGSLECWLCLAVTSRLDSWSSDSDWDIVDGEDHYYLVPCFYDERFSGAMLTQRESEAGSPAGAVATLADPPFYIPKNILQGIPVSENIDGATVYLSETYGGRSAPRYPLSDRLNGERCPDLTNWLWDEIGEDCFEGDPYLSLEGTTPRWYHGKLYWTLRNPSGGASVPDGGSFDIRSFDSYSGNYFLRIVDYAKRLDSEDFEP